LEVVAHVGSAHTPGDLALLAVRADEIVHAGQEPLFGGEAAGEAAVRGGGQGRAVVTRTYSQVLWRELTAWWRRLGFTVVDDDVFRQVVLARIVEPVSKRDTIRVLESLGLAPPSESAIYRSLRRCQDHDYRGALAEACWRQVAGAGPVGLLLYDVTTLYFEIHEEDDWRKSGYSKERRLEPQILVGLLVDQRGFPLMIHTFEGSKAETLTIIPVVQQFARQRHLPKLTVVADAGMLTEKNLEQLEDAGFDFIVGSKTTKFPYYLDAHAAAHPEVERGDGWTLCWPLLMGTKDKPRRRTLVMQYREARARLDQRNIDKQVAKATLMVTGDRPVTRSRFLTVEGGARRLNQPLIDRARKLAGYKGYVTNLPLASPDTPGGASPEQIIGSYHQLFQVEQSFRMSKHDLKARPIFHHLRDSIEAHLTVVFAALALSRNIQDTTGLSIRRWRHLIEPLRTAEIAIGEQTLIVPPDIPEDTRNLLIADEGD